MEYSIKTTSGPLVFKTGSEGPRHDPYAYDETTFRGWTIHQGLVEFIVNERTGDKAYGEYTTPGHSARDLFKANTGYTPEELRHFYDAARSRCHKCGCRHTETHRGYPGEWVEVCTQCGDVVCSSFNESEMY